MMIFNLGSYRVEVENDVSFQDAIKKPLMLSQMFSDVPTLDNLTQEEQLEQYAIKWRKSMRTKHTGMKELF